MGVVTVENDGQFQAEAKAWFLKPNLSLWTRNRSNIDTASLSLGKSLCPPLWNWVSVTWYAVLLLCNVSVGRGVWAPCFQDCVISKKELWPLSRTGWLNRGPDAKWGSQEKGEKRKFWLLHEDETGAPTASRWQPYCLAAALGSGCGQSWAGGREETVQAKQKRWAKSLALWEKWVSTLVGSCRLGGECPSTFKFRPHKLIKAKLVRKTVPTKFSNITNNNNHHSHLFSIYSKVFTYLLKSLERSYSFTQKIFIQFLLGIRHSSRHLRQIKGQGRQNPGPHSRAAICNQ